MSNPGNAALTCLLITPEGEMTTLPVTPPLPQGLLCLRGPRPVPGDAGFDAQATIGDQTGPAESFCSWQVCKESSLRERRWALALTTRGRCETTLDVMDVVTDTAPEAPPEVTEVVGPTAGRKYATELIGTFLFLFTIGASVVSSSALAPLAIGAVLMVMIYAGGHVSGGHYNPAVTIAALVRGRIGLADAVGYWVAQIVGGLLAMALAVWVIHPAQVNILTLSGHLLGAAFVVELLFTFALCYVVLNVATSEDHPNNSFYGLAIGFTVLAGAIAVGAISGGVFNPAVAIGGAAIGLFAWATLWAYLVAQVVAGTAAGLVFLALNPDDK
jgi:aquaporin Z